jgi:oligoribonuclease NrnB/cAMP/cGMP phosphodiesterase (DHH superfamily)
LEQVEESVYNSIYFTDKTEENQRFKNLLKIVLNKKVDDNIKLILLNFIEKVEERLIDEIKEKKEKEFERLNVDILESFVVWAMSKLYKN